MNGAYEIKGSNTLYKVWGIITFVFAGFYGLPRLLSFAYLIIKSSEIKSKYSAYLSLLGQGTVDKIQKYLILIVAALTLGVIIGLLIRILSGLCLIRPYIKSKGVMIALAVCYFLMAVGNLVWGIIWKKMHLTALLVYFLFLMLWAIATGVFLIMKQAMAVAGAGEWNGYGAQDSHMFTNGENLGVDGAGDPYMITDGERYEVRDGAGVGYVPPYDIPQAAPEVQQPQPDMGVAKAAEPELKACIEGLFGDYIGKKYILRVGENCRIGRDSGCDIQLRHLKVSRIHCAVKLLPDGRFEITDSSYNGTFYENTPLPNGVPTIVEGGGMLVAGDAKNVLSLKVC